MESLVYRDRFRDMIRADKAIRARERGAPRTTTRRHDIWLDSTNSTALYYCGRFKRYLYYASCIPCAYVALL